MTLVLATDVARPPSQQRMVSGHGRTHLDLFSGIGGFALAAQAAGYTTIGFSEIDEYATRLLKQHWPEVPNYGDIRNVRGVHADLITGGFPCQPFSGAGKRRGAEDDRHLWPEMCRVIDDAKPAWVIGENVSGIINMELDGVLSDLESLGYSAWPFVVPAVALDARHRRDRVWIVAYAGHLCRWRRAEPNGQEHAATANGCENLADAKLAGLERQRIAGGSDTRRTRPERANESAASRGAVADAMRRGRPGQGQSDDASNPATAIERQATESFNGGKPHVWKPEPELGRVANGIPNRAHRLRGLGNAIVPQIAEAFIRWTLETDETRMTANEKLSD